MLLPFVDMWLPWGGDEMSQAPVPDPRIEQAKATLAILLSEDWQSVSADTIFRDDILQALVTLEQLEYQTFALIKSRLKRAKISVRDLDRSLDHFRPSLRIVREEESSDTGTAGSYLEDAPLPDLVIPQPYLLRNDATLILRESDDPEKPPYEQAIAYAPLLITGRLRHIEDQTEWFRLEWKRGSQWLFRYVDRGVALNAAKLLDLASHGLPVATDNAANVAHYLHLLEAANYPMIPTAHMSTRLGWQGEQGQHGFLWGKALIRAHDAPVTTCDLNSGSTKDWRPDWVAFQGAAAGDDQIVQGFHARGSLSGWKDAVKAIASYPKVLLGLYASFAPALLELLHIPNFAMDWSGRTSMGKTTTLRVVASPWGCPDERRIGETILFSWFMTRVWPERAAAIMSGLPFILDESKLAPKEIIPQVLYMVCNGVGKGRGSPRGLATSKRWHTILFSSGESPVTSMSEDGGTRMRCFSIHGYPFNTKDQATLKLVSELNTALQLHYGHAGPLFVQWLSRNRRRVPLWEETHAQFKQKFMSQVSDEAAFRLSDYAALIKVTAELVHQALDLPWALPEAIPQDLWTSIVQEASGAAGDHRALRHVLSWAYAHQEAFEGRHLRDVKDGSPKPPPGGWAGVWPKGEKQLLALLPHVLDRVLEEGHFDPTAIKEAWRENGWLELDIGRKTFVKRHRALGGSPRLVTINLAKADTELDS
jgi:putative DNA primase/helicase